MSITILEPVQPDQEAIATASAAVDRIRADLARHPGGPATLHLRVDEDVDELAVPRSAVELFVQVLAHMAAGHGVSVVPGHAELTTQQAADLLNVSRPYLIRLLDQGDVEYRKVGKHRRIRAASLFGFMRANDHRRRAATDELTALVQEMGLDE